MTNQMSLEKIFEKHYKIKRSVLKEPEFGSKYEDIHFLTSAGEKAYAKLIALIYDLQELIGEDLIDANEIVEELDDIRDGRTYRLSNADVAAYKAFKEKGLIR